MSTSEIFKKEWKAYKKSKNYSSNKDAVEKDDALGPFETQPETISRFCTGKRDLTDQNIEFFAKLFGIRTEYLSGKDNFRTDADKMLYESREKNLRNSFNNILKNLGYANLSCNGADYNVTFPENTKAYIEVLKQIFNEKDNFSAIFDVQNDLCVYMTTEYENQLINEILDFIKFKLEQLFNNHSEPIPQWIDGNGKRLQKAHIEIKLKDGSILRLDNPYTPSAQIESSGEVDFSPILSIKEPIKDSGECALPSDEMQTD